MTKPLDKKKTAKVTVTTVKAVEVKHPVKATPKVAPKVTTKPVPKVEKEHKPF